MHGFLLHVPWRSVHQVLAFCYQPLTHHNSCHLPCPSHAEASSKWMIAPSVLATCELCGWNFLCACPQAFVAPNLYNPSPNRKPHTKSPSFAMYIVGLPNACSIARLWDTLSDKKFTLCEAVILIPLERTFSRAVSEAYPPPAPAPIPPWQLGNLKHKYAPPQ